MTEKQERILKTALSLFAQEGFAATSTSKVAREAGVSEGLIFRHFSNKEGLLSAIMQQAEESAKLLFADVIMTSDPKKMLLKIIELPFNMPTEEHEMWRLMYALKWQTNSYDSNKMEPLKLALNNTFRKLGYKNPSAETELILMFIDGAVTSILLHPPVEKEAIISTLKKKYQL